MSHRDVRAYIAGFLDGEGYISLCKGHNGYRPTLEVSGVDSRPLRLIQSFYGGKLYVARKKKTGHKDAKRLVMNRREDLLRILEDVTPHMIVKAAQAKLMLEYLHRYLKNKTAPVGEREVYYKAFLVLNGRGDDPVLATRREALLKVL